MKERKQVKLRFLKCTKGNDVFYPLPELHLLFLPGNPLTGSSREVFYEWNGCIFSRERHKRLNHTVNDRSVQLRLTQNFPFCWLPSFLLLHCLSHTTPTWSYHGPKCILRSLHSVSFTVHGGNILTSHTVNGGKSLTLLDDCSHKWQAAQGI